MKQLLQKQIVLGVTGGIAAYKSAELVRQLKQHGAIVRVVMTHNATAFVTPLTFQALSGEPVSTDLLDPAREASMSHITLARWADIILIAPASADMIAKLRAGIADDLLSTLVLASEAALFIAPAMNRVMWSNPATQENISILQQRGYSIIGPAKGAQACGEQGAGRMVEPADLCRAVAQPSHPTQLKAIKLLISAGPTREAIDPVRYITNRSSGKMGYAIAEAATAAGACVTLISGPVTLPMPNVDRLIKVESAAEMHHAVLSEAESQHIYIGTAAVADYRPVMIETKKIKKSGQQTTLILEPTVDILAAVAAIEHAPFTVGFAAETDQLEEYARKKLENKSLDMIAANLVGQNEGGFDSDKNALDVFWHDGHRHLPMADKRLVAAQLITVIAERYHRSLSEK